MPSSANALASLTFAVPLRVEPVQALARNLATTLRPATTSVLAALVNTGEAATTGDLPTDFRVAKGTAGAMPAAVAVASLPDPGLGDASAGSPVRIGMLGRALAAALPATAQARPEAPLLLAGVEVSALDTTRFASMLARAVTQSGICYEAHLLDWVEGRRSVDQIRSEPPAQVPAPAGSQFTTALSVAATVTPVPAKAPTAALTAAPSPATSPLQTSTDSGRVVESPSLTWTSAQQITAAQLRFIDGGEARFALQAWPAQVCELHLRRDDHSAASQYREAGSPQGDGTLVLTLPHLGKVEARLRTSGNHVQITLDATSLAAADQLKRAAAALSHELGLAGLKLVGVEVHEPRA